MKTLIVCIVATIVASANGLFFSGFGGGGGGRFNQRPAPQEYLHHHHHHHEVVHKSFGGDHHQLGYFEKPVEVHPLHVEYYKIIHEQAHPQHHGGGQGHQQGYGIEEGHGQVFVQPIVNKNFIHSQHEHHYHHIASAPAHYHGWN